MPRPFPDASRHRPLRERSEGMSGANASPTGRSQEKMSGANASPTGRSQEKMSGANASPIGRSQERMHRVSRREFLKTSGALIVTFSLAPESLLAQRLDGASSN